MSAYKGSDLGFHMAAMALGRSGSEAISLISVDTVPLLDSDLFQQYSLCTTSAQGTEEEEEQISRQLTAELAADFAKMCFQGAGQWPGPWHTASEHSKHLFDDSKQQQQGQHIHASRRASLQTNASSLPRLGSAAASAETNGGMEEQLPPASLFEQLGGVAVKLVMDEFRARVLGMPVLARVFEGVSAAGLHRWFLLFVAYVLGGPDEFVEHVSKPWPQLYHARERLIGQFGLTESHFDAVKSLLGDTLRHAGAMQHVVDQALVVVESTWQIIFPLQSDLQL